MSRVSAAGTAATGLALVAAAPTPAAAVATLTSPASAVDPLAPLLALLALTAWALLAWLVVVALAASAARLPGKPGTAAGWCARRVAPSGVRRLVEVALGLTVAAGVLVATPASAGTHVPPAPPAAASSLDWPTPPSPSVVPSLDWSPHVASPSAAAAAAPAPAPAPVRAPVVVRPGDSLWAVAADHLPAGASNAQIAQAWPAWWSANRKAVGPDPDLIHPGLSLTPPAQP